MVNWNNLDHREALELCLLLLVVVGSFVVVLTDAGVKNSEAAFALIGIVVTGLISKYSRQ